MKGEVNLLPLELQELRSWRVYGTRMMRLARLLIGGLVTLGAFLLVVGGVYSYLAQNAEATLSEEGAAVNSQRERVADINARLRVVDQWRRQTSVWSPDAVEVLQKLPNGVQVAQLRVNDEPNILQVNGTFTSREQLIVYQRSLEALEWVEKVDAPLSNFQTGADQEFVLRLQRATQGGKEES